MLHSNAKFIRLFLPLLLAAALLIGFTSVLAASSASLDAAPAAPEAYATLDEVAIFEHLEAGKRLQLIVEGPAHPAGTLVAPDGDWEGGGEMITGTQSFSTAWALRAVPVGVFRTSVTDTLGQDIAWEFGDIEQVLANEYDCPMRY